MTKDARTSRSAIVKITFQAVDDDGLDATPAVAFREYMRSEGVDPNKLKVVKMEHLGPYATWSAAFRVPQDLLARVLELDDTVVLNPGRT